METINVFEVLPEEDSKTIADLIWKLLDKAGIETTKDAELQIEVYDEEEDQHGNLSTMVTKLLR